MPPCPSLLFSHLPFRHSLWTYVVLWMDKHIIWLHCIVSAVCLQWIMIPYFTAQNSTNRPTLPATRDFPDYFRGQKNWSVSRKTSSDFENAWRQSSTRRQLIHCNSLHGLSSACHVRFMTVFDDNCNRFPHNSISYQMHRIAGAIYHHQFPVPNWTIKISELLCSTHHM